MSCYFITCTYFKQGSKREDYDDYIRLVRLIVERYGGGGVFADKRKHRIPKRKLETRQGYHYRVSGQGKPGQMLFIRRIQANYE